MTEKNCVIQPIASYSVIYYMIELIGVELKKRTAGTTPVAGYIYYIIVCLLMDK